ncbi:MAG: TIGR03936 family radical SAM-associated protein [Candidatus Omnitrophica bacterium]|nr:TIGR03936 family radical SAM-associated protein [Candidatus Omnitrophota bacterium]
MQNSKFPVNLEVEKTGEMIYFSQLDLTLILKRALRRANLPNYFTKGFRPHIKISFKDALRLGKEGKLIVTFYFNEKLTPNKIIAKLNSEFPLGLEIKKINE